MIKEILEQLAPLDAQIAALKGSGNDMEAITAHASELAELAVEEDEILRSCGPLTAEDRVFLARHPERPHIDETVSALFTDFFEQRGDRQCKEDSASRLRRGPDFPCIWIVPRSAPGRCSSAAWRSQHAYSTASLFAAAARERGVRLPL